MSDNSSDYSSPDLDTSVDVVDDISLEPNDSSKSADTAGGTKLIYHCQRCMNHQTNVKRKGHSRYCPYKECLCENCVLVSQRKSLIKQLDLKIRSDLHRVSDFSSTNEFGNTTKRNSKTRSPRCTRCAVHLPAGLQSEAPLLKGHKKLCPYLECICSKCEIVEIRRTVMAKQISVRRQQRAENDHLSSSAKTTATTTTKLETAEEDPACQMLKTNIVTKSQQENIIGGPNERALLLVPPQLRTQRSRPKVVAAASTTTESSDKTTSDLNWLGSEPVPLDLVKKNTNTSQRLGRSIVPRGCTDPAISTSATLPNMISCADNQSIRPSVSPVNLPANCSGAPVRHQTNRHSTTFANSTAITPPFQNSLVDGGNGNDHTHLTQCLTGPVRPTPYHFQQQLQVPLLRQNYSQQISFDNPQQLTFPQYANFRAPSDLQFQAAYYNAHLNQNMRWNLFHQAYQAMANFVHMHSTPMDTLPSRGFGYASQWPGHLAYNPAPPIIDQLILPTARTHPGLPLPNNDAHLVVPRQEMQQQHLVRMPSMPHLSPEYTRPTTSNSEQDTNSSEYFRVPAIPTPSARKQTTAKSKFRSP